MDNFFGHFLWTLFVDTYCVHFLGTLNYSAEIIVNKKHNEKQNYLFSPETLPMSYQDQLIIPVS